MLFIFAIIITLASLLCFTASKYEFSTSQTREPNTAERAELRGSAETFLWTGTALFFSGMSIIFFQYQFLGGKLLAISFIPIVIGLLLIPWQEKAERFRQLIGYPIVAIGFFWLVMAFITFPT